MANIIEHQGIVENTGGTHIRVRIVRTSACASCSAKGHCSSADSKENIIEVNGTGIDCKPGDRVTIIGRMSMGMKAVFIAFFAPFFLLVISLFILMTVTGNNELLSGFFSLSLLVPYYIILRIKKDSLKKEFSFTIKTTKITDL